MTVIARSEAGPGEADVVIVCGDREPGDRIAFRQLAEAVSSTIVAIDSAGASATILRVTAERAPIGAASDLREAVRRAARRRVRATN
jgi:hypothetical protein